MLDAINLLLARVARKVKDPRLLHLVHVIVHHGGEQGRGLPIGNLTSQLLANVYLDALDHHVKETLRVRGYLRYMDDFVLFGAERRALAAQREALRVFLADALHLSLHPRATYLNRSSHGLSFLGARVFPHHLRLKPASRRRSLKRLAARNHGEKPWRGVKTMARGLVSCLRALVPLVPAF
jgi:RNA-directed DNA polymerase